MDADSGLGGKFSDESGNFFTISPYNQTHRKESKYNPKVFVTFRIYIRLGSLRPTTT